MPRFRVITIARQYGSGGGPIAHKLAARLGWDLLDNALITHIAIRRPRSIAALAKNTMNKWIRGCIV